MLWGEDDGIYKIWYNVFCFLVAAAVAKENEKGEYIKGRRNLLICVWIISLIEWNDHFLYKMIYFVFIIAYFVIYKKNRNAINLWAKFNLIFLIVVYIKKVYCN